MHERTVELLNELMERDPESVDDLMRCPTHSGLTFLDILNRVLEAEGKGRVVYYTCDRGCSHRFALVADTGLRESER